jgi:hypothetical protein
MALKKAEFNDDEVPIFEEALVYKRGEYWQMRMWLAKEHKYARFSLKTRKRATAIDKAKLHYHELMAGQLQGKSYFSITTRMGVEMYLEHRKKDVTNGYIVSGRYNTIADATRTVAERRGMLPSEAQAAAWVSWKAQAGRRGVAATDMIRRGSGRGGRPA